MQMENIEVNLLIKSMGISRISAQVTEFKINKFRIT